MAKYKKLLTRDQEVGTQIVNQRVQSSWINSIGLATVNNDRIVLTVEFKSGTKIGYTFTRDEQAVDWWDEWVTAASKGQWLHKMFYNHPYIYLT